MIDRALHPALENGSCPHLAGLLRSEEELPQVLASFYALGAKRDGWLAHRSVAGQAGADRAALTRHGLPVEELEREGRLGVAEFDPLELPERSTDRWERGLDEALASGRSALWYSRFAVGRDRDAYDAVLAFERQWDHRFAGRPVVTLCPYVVGDLSTTETLDRLGALSDIHDGVLTPEADGFALIERAVG